GLGPDDEDDAFGFGVVGDPPEPLQQMRVAPHAGHRIDSNAHDAGRPSHPRLAEAAHREPGVKPGPSAPALVAESEDASAGELREAGVEIEPYARGEAELLIVEVMAGEIRAQPAHARDVDADRCPGHPSHVVLVGGFEPDLDVPPPAPRAHGNAGLV